MFRQILLIALLGVASLNAQAPVVYNSNAVAEYDQTTASSVASIALTQTNAGFTSGT